jgi:hypothetical protein
LTCEWSEKIIDGRDELEWNEIANFVVLYTMFEMFIVMQNQQEGKKKSFV